MLLRRAVSIQFRYGPNKGKGTKTTAAAAAASAPPVAASVKDLPRWMQPRPLDQDEVDAINGGGAPAPLIIDKKKPK